MFSILGELIFVYCLPIDNGQQDDDAPAMDKNCVDDDTAVAIINQMMTVVININSIVCGNKKRNIEFIHLINPMQQRDNIFCCGQTSSDPLKQTNLCSKAHHQVNGVNNE